MSCFEKLTEKDKELIESYLEIARTGETRKYCSLEELLSFWNDAKGKYLESLFKDQLIIKKEITYTEDIEQIKEKLIIIKNKNRKFVYEMENCIFSNSTPESAKNRSVIFSLFSETALAKNAAGITAELPLPNGKIIKIQESTKPIPVIGKLARAYNIEGFEEFRLDHSRCLNQKELKGELCLSIHPLDYMTMSDNNNGWSSCMSWVENGEYRQGTVEMMNSPCVVMAYLTGSDEFEFSYQQKWNSKKWRCLFIVDKDFIINIKQYPYYNKSLLFSAFNALTKLCGWGNINPVEYKYKEKITINERKVYLRFITEFMYNDFGTAKHFLVINPNRKEDLIEHEYMYSGVCECMQCGSTIINREDTLLCSCCSTTKYCENCDDPIYEDQEYFIVDDEIICSYCYDNYCYFDSITGEAHLNENIEKIYLIPNNKASTYHARVIYISPYNIGTKEWLEYFKIEKCHDDNYFSWLSPEDCTPEGLRLFGIYDEIELKEYLENNFPETK